MTDTSAEQLQGEPTDWSTEAIVSRRDRFYAASQRKFVPYATPQIFERGSYQYLWDEKGAKYTDLLGMNLCISPYKRTFSRTSRRYAVSEHP